MSAHPLWSFPPFSTTEESVGEVLSPTYSWNNWTILASASDVPHPGVLGHWALSSQCHLQCCLGIWQEGVLPSLHQDITNTGMTWLLSESCGLDQACLTVEFPAWIHMSGSMKLPSQSRVPLAMSGASRPNHCEAQRRKQLSSPSLRSTFKGWFFVPGIVSPLDDRPWEYLLFQRKPHPPGPGLWPWPLTQLGYHLRTQQSNNSEFLTKIDLVFVGRVSPKPVWYHA